jgi:hypothetical protein
VFHNEMCRFSLIRPKPNNADTRGNLKPVLLVVAEEKVGAASSGRSTVESIGTQKVIITDQKRRENTNKYANGRSRLDERPLSPGIEPVPPPQQPRGFQKLAQIAPGVSVVGSTPTSLLLSRLGFLASA